MRWVCQFLVDMPRNTQKLSHDIPSVAFFSCPFLCQFVIRMCLGLGESFEKKPDIASFGPGPQFHRLQGRRGSFPGKRSQLVSLDRKDVGRKRWGFTPLNPVVYHNFPFFSYIKNSILHAKRKALSDRVIGKTTAARFF